MIVMKFGGTSVEDARAIERVAAIVKDRLPQKPVVVVSAMAKVTDTLLTMARAAGAGERKTALNSAARYRSDTTTPPANCWARRCSPTFTRNSEAISRNSMNCCVAFRQSAS